MCRATRLRAHGYKRMNNPVTINHSALTETLALFVSDGISLEGAAALIGVTPDSLRAYAGDPDLMKAVDKLAAQMVLDGRTIPAKAKAHLNELLDKIGETITTGDMSLSTQVRLAEVLFKITGIAAEREVARSREPFSISIILPGSADKEIVVNTDENY